MTNVQRSRRQVRLSHPRHRTDALRLPAHFSGPYAPGEHGRTRQIALSPITQCVCAKSSVFALSMASRQLRAAREGHPHRRPDPVAPC